MTDQHPSHPKSPEATPESFSSPPDSAPEPDSSKGSHSEDNHQPEENNQSTIVLTSISLLSGLIGITFLTGLFFYLKIDGWLSRGQEIRNSLVSPDPAKMRNCFDQQFDAVNSLLILPTENSKQLEVLSQTDPPNATVDATQNSTPLPTGESFKSIDNLLKVREELFLEKLKLQEKQASLGTQGESNDLQREIKLSEGKIQLIEASLGELGFSKVSTPEILRLSNQISVIQKRILLHHDITRWFYAFSEAFAVSASLSLLGGSISLFLVTKDGWDEINKKKPLLLSALFTFGGFYILSLNLPRVLSTEDNFKLNLAQYIGYVNLEGEICTALATERFDGTPESPDTISEVEFNRLIYSVERKMQQLNARNVSPNISAIEGFIFNLDSLDIPAKKEAETPVQNTSE